MADPGLLEEGAPGHGNQMPQPSVDGNYQSLKVSCLKCPPLDLPL